MNKTALVVFDIAGTTVSDAGNINDCFRNAFTEAGIEVESEEVDTVMGYRKIDAVRIIVEKYSELSGAENEKLIDRIHTRFNELMVAFYQETETLTPLPYAEDIFKWLQEKQIKVALNTGFTRVITNALLARLGWNNHPDINKVICSDEAVEGRPASYMIQYLMNELQVTDVKEVVKVGDTEVDVKEGRNAGCGLVIAVTTGAYTRAQLEQCQPDHIIDSLEQLRTIL
ncbi:MAG TPA: phosphonoacetaldehyde hydrolase [Chitinophagaceae bacterium]|nr:phosphonoacetaldehyde hydrolase [Chitinophagaceae bacterium]